MRTFRAAAAAALVLTLPAAQAAGSVEVSWRESASYSDAGRSEMDRDEAMRRLGHQMARLGRLLPDGQTLKLEVLDLDLAGEIEHRGWHEVRVLRGRADWPRMRLRYALSAGGRTLRSGEAELADMNYAWGTRRDDRDPEPRMVERWVKESFVAR